MSKWKQLVLGKMGYTYGGLTNKTILDFGIGKPFLPYMNIFSNGKINPRFVNYVQIHYGEKQNTVKYGDLFFTTSSETVEEVGMTSVLLDEMGEAYLNSFCFGFRLNNFDDLLPEFVPYLFRGEVMRKKISLFGQGSTRYNLPKTELLEKLTIDLPTLPEQRKIAQILSTADSVIERTQLAIAKYKAMKQGMVYDLFTRGIDIKTGKLRPKYKDAPELYKKSKMGMIPKDWIVEELKDCTDLIKDGTHGTHKDVSNGVPLLSAKDVAGGIVKIPEDCRKISLSDYLQIHTNYEIVEDDILLTIVGTIGRSAIVKNKQKQFTFQRSVAILRTQKKKILSDYFFQFVNTDNFQKQLIKSMNASAQGGVYLGEISKMIICFSKEMQEQIEINKKLQLIDQKINTEQIYLQKLQQIKSGLMTGLLSGKKLVKVTIELETQTT